MGDSVPPKAVCEGCREETGGENANTEQCAKCENATTEAKCKSAEPKQKKTVCIMVHHQAVI